MSKLALMALVVSLGLNAFAAPNVTPTSAETTSVATAPKAHVQKEHTFDDLLVQGQFHFSEEAVSTVEADKVLDAMIGVRKDFKDRLELSDKGY